MPPHKLANKIFLINFNFELIVKKGPFHGKNK